MQDDIFEELKKYTSIIEGDPSIGIMDKLCNAKLALYVIEWISMK
jgi:hypothetical protein